MASTVFQDKVTPIVSSWLNDANAATYGRDVWASLYGHSTSASAAVNDAAIVAAVTACQAAGGGTVRLKAGTFNHSSIVWNPATNTRVNLRGSGKNTTILQKADATSTPVLDVSAVALTGLFASFSDFAILGVAFGSPGLRTTLCSNFSLRNLYIGVCSTAWDNVGSLVITSYDVDLRGNVNGYHASRSGSVYPNLVTFFGGQVLGNTGIGFDIVHGHGYTWDHVDIEANGVTSTTTTGGIFIRSTTNLEIAYGCFTITNNCWFEGNYGVPVMVENATGIVFTCNGGTKFIRNATTNSALVMQIGSVESSCIENILATSSITGNCAITIAASRSTVKTSLINFLTDTSSGYTHIEVGTIAAFIQARVGGGGSVTDVNAASASFAGPITSGLGANIGGTKVSKSWSVADAINSTVTTDIPVAVTSNVYGALVFVRGRNLANGISFTRLYLLSIKTPGGGGSDVVSTTVASNGDATPAFTFANSGGFLQITNTTGSGGLISLISG